MPGFEIDDRKLRRGLELIPTPRTLDDDASDLKWSGAFFGLIVGVIAWAGFVVLLLLRALF